MQRFKISLLAAAGILMLAFVLTAVGPKRVAAALGYTPVRDVDFAARQPILVLLNTGSGGTGPVYTVPANKRLVIESVSLDASAVNGSVRDVQLQIWDAGLTGFIGVIPFPALPMTTEGTYKTFAYAGATKIYVEPGTAGFAPGTALKLWVNGTVNNTSAELTFSGYLEPL